MHTDPRQTVGAISEKTLANIRAARCSVARIQNGTVYWSWWTDRTRWLPERYDSVVSWWELGPVMQVRWRTWYWLRFGLSLVEPQDPHERMHDAY